MEWIFGFCLRNLSNNFWTWISVKLHYGYFPSSYGKYQNSVPHSLSDWYVCGGNFDFNFGNAAYKWFRLIMFNTNDVLYFIWNKLGPSGDYPKSKVINFSFIKL